MTVIFIDNDHFGCVFQVMAIFWNRITVILENNGRFGNIGHFGQKMLILELDDGHFRKQRSFRL